MGCDIHLVLEKKFGEKWIGVDTFNGHETAYGKGWASPTARSRNYTRFAALANVRGEGGLEPKGIPSDASDTTQALSDEWGGDGHSHSWLPVDEAAAIFAKTERELTDEYAKKCPAAHFFGAEGDLSVYRLVFWFDN